MEIRYFKFPLKWNKKNLKKQYRKLASEYHPDRKTGCEMAMKVINEENDYLLKNIGCVIKYFNPPPPKKTPEQLKKESEYKYKKILNFFKIKEHEAFFTHLFKIKLESQFIKKTNENEFYFRIFSKCERIVFLLIFKDYKLNDEDEFKFVGKALNVKVRLHYKYYFDVSRVLIEKKDFLNNMKICYGNPNFKEINNYLTNIRG